MTDSGANETRSDALRSLDEIMRKERKKWGLATTTYGFTYYASRIVLIVATSIVAAKETLNDGTGDFLVAWVPLLSVAVAVLTALDTWLKPQQKWKGFMESRDAAANLVLKGQGTAVDVEKLREDFVTLQKTHRDLNVF